jgi:hypothetical protein
MFGLLIASGIAMADSPAPASERSTRSRAQVYDAIVSTFGRLQTPVTSQTPESGTVVAETHSGFSAFAKFTFITAKATETSGGTRVTYTRESMRSVNTNRKLDDDPKATAEFFATLDAD